MKLRIVAMIGEVVELEIPDGSLVPAVDDVISYPGRSAARVTGRDIRLGIGQVPQITLYVR